MQSQRSTKQLLLKSKSIGASLHAFKESIVVFLLSWLLLSHTDTSFLLIASSIAWSLWQFGHRFWIGWKKLERDHYLLTQLHWQIEHDKERIKEKLMQSYRARGLKEELLQRAVEATMSDRGTLLNAMLRESGLETNRLEHPLKGAAQAALASILASSICMLILISPLLGISTIAIAIAAVSTVTAQIEQSAIVPSIIWNLGTIFSIFYCMRFLCEWLYGV